MNFTSVIDGIANNSNVAEWAQAVATILFGLLVLQQTNRLHKQNQEQARKNFEATLAEQRRQMDLQILNEDRHSHVLTLRNLAMENVARAHEFLGHLMRGSFNSSTEMRENWERARSTLDRIRINCSIFCFIVSEEPDVKSAEPSLYDKLGKLQGVFTWRDNMISDTKRRTQEEQQALYAKTEEAVAAFKEAMLLLLKERSQQFLPAAAL